MTTLVFRQSESLMPLECSARAAYELPLSAAEGKPRSRDAGATALLEQLISENLRWFIRLRWVAICFLVVLWILGLLGQRAYATLGLRAPGQWPLVIAVVLLVANLLFLLHARRIAGRPASGSARRNLLCQIVLDLLVLTSVVHFLGSVETYAPFMYLVHIVLACIFFSAPLSVAVTALACALYVMCVACEHLALVPPSTIYASVRPPLALGELVVVVLSAIAIWLVVWYLASRLAGRLRKREFELFHKNRRLVALQVERTRHMLRTTHELKAPFAAIAANAQLLLKGSYGALPPGAVEVVQRIAARCRRLAHEIQEMLQLANLESAHEAPPRTELDLADIARWAVSHVGPSARERGVTVEAELARTPASVVEDHMKMLLGNIVGNAVIYSHDGGVVRLACHPEGDGGATIIVEDEGIGIARAKLPRIFDEYYRTEEAAKHNKDSTGLGLAICRHVAQAHRIGLLVESEQGRGTRLTLRFPPQPTKKGGVPWLTL